MNTSLDRQTFRTLVADVAARAKEKLPQAVNGRLEKAAALVLMHDVTPQPDGSILVGSSTDPLQQYRLQGTSCECQDFVYGKAPAGWCAHRIAANLQRSVERVLARAPQTLPVDPEALPEAFPDNDPGPLPERELAPAPPLPEAPASVNCHLMIAGRQVQLTLRDRDEGRLLQRLQMVLAQYPLEAQAQAQTASQGEGWCQKHKTAMQQNHKDGRSWWSHKTAEGWCKGKVF